MDDFLVHSAEIPTDTVRCRHKHFQVDTTAYGDIDLSDEFESIQITKRQNRNSS